MSYLSTKSISITESFFGNGFELLTEEAQENKVKEKLDDAIENAADKPKGWISNKIHSFRQLYKTYLDKANREHDSGKIGFFKNIARMILSCMDKLAKFLQNATDQRSSTEKMMDHLRPSLKNMDKQFKDTIKNATDSIKISKTFKSTTTDNFRNNLFSNKNSQTEKDKREQESKDARSEITILQNKAATLYKNNSTTEHKGNGNNVITWNNDKSGKKAKEEYRNIYNKISELDKKYNFGVDYKFMQPVANS